MASICKNCFSALQDDFRFCPNCSQCARLHRLSMHDVAHEAMHYFTHADKSLLSLIRDLAVKSGSVAREYCDGMRKKYFPPLSFFLIVATVYVVLATLEPRTGEVNAYMRSHPSYVNADAEQRKKMEPMIEKLEHANQIITRNSKYALMALLPLSAFVFWIFLINGRYNYAEHLIANLYMGGFLTLLTTVFMLPTLLFRFDMTGVLWLILLVSTAYGSIFYYRFMSYHGFAGAVKVVFLNLFATAVTYVVFMAGALAYALI